MLTGFLSIQTGLLNGTISATANQWPHFLFENDEYDPENLDQGLLRGYVLVRVRTWE